MDLPTSPFAPTSLPDMPIIDGVRIATARTGMKYKDRDDLLLMQLSEGTIVAGVFTTSYTAAAPVRWCKKHIEKGAARGLIVNAGNANAFIGKQEDTIAEAMVLAAAQHISCDVSEVFVASTGVIGEPFDVTRITDQLSTMQLVQEGGQWYKAATAIKTTDTFDKVATCTTMINGKEVSINGIAKGSGMIAPNMATMLSFIATDAAISQDALQGMLAECNARSFNSITVDSDTSTNDTVLLFATGKAGNDMCEHSHDPALRGFKEALQALMIDLAQQIVCDGEGISKYVTVHVSGADSHADAHLIAMSIANSPLVKTAIAGEDPNWGRIIMAIGKAGVTVDANAISVAIGPYFIARNGEVVPGYDESPVAAYMQESEIDITVEVGTAAGEANVWTCDLTHGYIDINADYRS